MTAVLIPSKSAGKFDNKPSPPWLCLSPPGKSDRQRPASPRPTHAHPNHCCHSPPHLVRLLHIPFKLLHRLPLNSPSLFSPRHNLDEQAMSSPRQEQVLILLPVLVLPHLSEALGGRSGGNKAKVNIWSKSQAPPSLHWTCPCSILPHQPSAPCTDGLLLPLHSVHAPQSHLHRLRNPRLL